MYDVYGSRAQDVEEKSQFFIVHVLIKKFLNKEKYKTIEVVEKEKEKEIVTKDLEEFKRDEERAAYELWLVFKFC